MNNSYVLSAGKDFYPEPEENIMDNIFKQYESVIVESIITSFGLDFLVKDRHGGDVDTIHNVRQVGKDERMEYKKKENQENYDNRGNYDSSAYHNEKQYKDRNREIRQQKEKGELIDSYTGQKIHSNEKSDLDHVISAKEIHDDPGRVLAGLDGTKLANSAINLQPTNPHTNRTKKADSMDEFLKKYGDEYTEEEKRRMRQKDAAARKDYEIKLAKAYYASPQFAKDVSTAAVNVGTRMGLRQALGFVFTEVWFCVKEEFANLPEKFDLGELFSSIGKGIKKGFSSAKVKYKEILSRFQEGLAAGAVSSLTTTLCNIFFTTAKNVVKIIRQTWASLVQAAKVLFINPDNLSFGERMRAVVKILATGASVVVGGVVSEAVGKTPLGMIPTIGDIVQTFCGTLVTGIMSCSLLYFFDRAPIMKKLVCVLDNLSFVSKEADYFRRQAAYFEKYAADLMQIDFDKFHKETEIYNSLVDQIMQADNEKELNMILKNAMNEIGITIPWKGDFDSFMGNKKSVLVFE